MIAIMSAALADLATRTGLTGEPLGNLTKNFMELQKITGEAAGTTIPSITRLFGDWSVATQDQAGTMDYLYRASQATGIGVGQLSQQMVQFGSPLRQLGFTFDETAAMFSKFEKEGVNVQTALPGLRMALKNLAKPSADLEQQMKQLGITAKEPKDRLIQFMDVIKKMPSTADANSLAFEVFGTRAGPDLAAAIREGRFEFGELIDEVKNGKDTIGDAADQSQTFGDKLTMLKNSFMTMIGPVGDVGALFFGLLAGAGPLLLALSQMGPAIKAIGMAFSFVFKLLAANPWMLLVAGLIIVVVLIIKHWDKVKAFLLKVWNVLKGAAIKMWNAIKSAAITIFNALKAPVIAYINFYKAIFRVVLTVAKTVWNGVKSIAVGVFNGIKNAFNTLKSGIINGWNAIKSVGSGIWGAIKDAASTVFNAIKSWWNSTIGGVGFTAPGWRPGIGGKEFRIPYMAAGGLVTSATLAMIGEAGPEAVIPLNRLNQIAGGKNINVQVRIDRRRFVDEQDYDATYRGF